ncbi:hypothetical protein [Lacrimispora sp.]|uniref:hypothetical protein n=1 Tax=Lacrimispora sp. TaxID=2719234 RepID=UPI0028AD6B35|nr:hypothetical protein [Lacrimispora sp.]
MSKGREVNRLPQKCYAVLPYDGRLVTITQGIPGYIRSPLDSGDRYKNRIIADGKNDGLGGVTSTDEKNNDKRSFFRLGNCKCRGWKI